MKGQRFGERYHYIDTNLLRMRCKQSIAELLGEPGFRLEEVEVVEQNKKSKWTSVDRYAFKDNGAKVLAIAHTDVAYSVRSFYQKFEVMHDKEFGGDYAVLSPALDDRLGAHIILDVLPQLGIVTDILLTDQEESGNSTAQHFLPPRDYNWIFQFDRSGTDVVMYQYDTDTMRRLLRKYGLTPGHGTFSDIAYLDHLGVTGFNFGTGYYSEHSKNCHAIIGETEKMIHLFQRFFFANQHRRLEYTPTPYSRYNSIGSRYGWDPYFDDTSYAGVSIRNPSSSNDEIPPWEDVYDFYEDDQMGAAWQDKDGLWHTLSNRAYRRLMNDTGIDVGEESAIDGSHPFLADDVGGYDYCQYCGGAYYVDKLRYSYIYDAVLCKSCAESEDVGREWKSLTPYEEALQELTRRETIERVDKWDDYKDSGWDEEKLDGVGRS